MLLFLIKRSNELWKNNLRKFLITSIFLKLLMDIGMVNYMTFPYIFIIAISYVFYYNYLASPVIGIGLDTENTIE